MYTFIINYRSSCPEVFLRKGVLKICSKFTGEHPCRNVISIKLLCTFDRIFKQSTKSNQKLLRVSCEYFYCQNWLGLTRLTCPTLIDSIANIVRTGQVYQNFGILEFFFWNFSFKVLIQISDLSLASHKSLTSLFMVVLLKDLLRIQLVEFVFIF